MAQTASNATRSDREEVKARKTQYEEFMSWTDRGILRDLKDLHDITSPCRHLLLAIAFNMTELAGVPLERQDKRWRELLVSWLNAHYDKFRCYIPHMVIRDKNNRTRGPRADEFIRYEQANPAALSIVYLH
jgi:hypothetical protein